MKKTIIALIALAGVAMAEESYATSQSITLSDAIAIGAHESTFAWKDINSKTKAENELADLLGEPVGASLITNKSWHYFEAAANKDSSTASYSFTNNTHVLKKGTTADANATILTYTLNVSELFSADFSSDYTQNINALTFTNTMTSVGDCYYTAFTVSSTGGVSCLSENGMNNKKADATFSVEGLQLESTDKIIVMYRQGDATATTITGLKIDAIGSATLVPEPATATLSLLALAGLAARRRRK